MEKGTPKKQKRRGRGKLIINTKSSKTASKAKSMLREISSGGVVFKKNKNGIYWLICRSNPSKDFPNEVWRLPKGWIDDKNHGKLPGIYSRGDKRASENLLKNTATREVEEEAGVEAEIVNKIGTEQFFYYSEERGGKTMKFVTFYLMKYLGDTKDGFGFETAETKWLEFKEAKNVLTHKGEKEVLEKAKKTLSSGMQEGLI